MSEKQPTFHLSTIDLHYHAGVERPLGVTLADYIQHAWDTGRRCQGVTDHIDLYVSDRPLTRDHRAYDIGLKGIYELHQDFSNLREHFPAMQLFFAPEYHTEYFPTGEIRLPFEQFPLEIASLSDYVICDVGLSKFAPQGLAAQTEAAVRTVRDIGELSQRIGVPTYYAHPLRGVIDRTISKYAHPDPEMNAYLDRVEAIFAAGQPFSEADLNQLFQVDLRALGRASYEYHVPLEVNGMTQDRIRARRPQLYPAYIQAYTIFAEAGATFVPGSDQHNREDFFKVIPRNEPFETLGLSMLDQSFFKLIGIDAESLFL